MQKNILITGMPLSGKSTLLVNVISRIPQKIGFITREVRRLGERVGFEIETHTGRVATLAGTGSNSPLRVARYGVSVQNLDSIIPGVSSFENEDVLYLDEVGPMQLFSKSFKKLALAFLDSENVCLATVSQTSDDPFIKEVLSRKDVILVTINETDRQEKEVYVNQLIGKIEEARRYVTEPSRFVRRDSKIELKSEQGKKELAFLDGFWQCPCDFFKKYQICGHSMAVSEVGSVF